MEAPRWGAPRPREATAAYVMQHADVVFQAAIDVFSRACGLVLQRSGDGNRRCGGQAMVAVVSLVGDVDWSVVLGLPRATATLAAARFAGFDIAFDSPERGDAVGELANILVGKTKALLERRGLRAEASLPSVLRAGDPEVLVGREQWWARACFDSDAGRLWTGVVAVAAGEVTG